jgi:glycosyltransferase
MLKVSVITVVLNSVRTIRHCLDSVRVQTHPAEHIVIDGSSTDGTQLVVEKYARPDLRAVSEPDRGIYDAMNKGIALATGDVIGILNADDEYASSDVLDRVVRTFTDSGAESCYGDLVYVDADDVFRVIRYWQSGQRRPNDFHWGWMPPHPTFFVRREVYEKYGHFNLDLGSAADYEMMLRLLGKHRVSTAYIPEVLVKMRAGGVSNASVRDRLKANRMDRKAWRVNDLQPYPWTLMLKPLRKVGQFFRTA